MKESVLGLQEKSQHNIGFPTFKLPESTKNILVRIVTPQDDLKQTTE